MKRRVLEIATGIAEQVSSWPGVEAATLGPAAEVEVFDPYFVIDVDVYLRGDEPPPERRRESLGSPPTFDTLPYRNADAYLAGELPVRVQYRDVAPIELNLRRASEGSWVYHRESGTNPFYRIERSRLLFERGDWYSRAVAALSSLPESFWEHVKSEARPWVDGSLQDLSAASYRSDDLFFVVAASRFVRSLCAFLFAANRRFEPDARMIHSELTALAFLPSEFVARFESFVRQNPPLSREKRREVAELLARSIPAL